MTRHRAKPKRKSSHVQTKRSPKNQRHWEKQVGYAVRMQQRSKFDKIKNQQRGVK